MTSQETRLSPEQRRKRKLQKAVKLLAEEIVDNGREMLGDMVYHEPQWASLEDVAQAIGVTLKKPKG